jgi:hypothetical protein
MAVLGTRIRKCLTFYALHKFDVLILTMSLLKKITGAPSEVVEVKRSFSRSLTFHRFSFKNLRWVSRLFDLSSLGDLRILRVEDFNSRQF